MRPLRLFLLVAVAAVLGLFYAPAKDGRPLLSLSELKGRAAGLTAGSAGDASPGGGGGEGVRTLYRWRGKDGTWSYSNVRPADRPEAEEVRVPVTWVQGAGGGAAEAEPESGAPRSAGELLEQSRDLNRKVEGRDARLRELMENP